MQIDTHFNDFIDDVIDNDHNDKILDWGPWSKVGASKNPAVLSQKAEKVAFRRRATSYFGCKCCMNCLLSHSFSAESK